MAFFVYVARSLVPARGLENLARANFRAARRAWVDYGRARAARLPPPLLDSFLFPLALAQQRKLVRQLSPPSSGALLQAFVDQLGFIREELWERFEEERRTSCACTEAETAWKQAKRRRRAARRHLDAGVLRIQCLADSLANAEGDGVRRLAARALHSALRNSPAWLRSRTGREAAAGEPRKRARTSLSPTRPPWSSAGASRATPGLELTSSDTDSSGGSSGTGPS